MRVRSGLISVFEELEVPLALEKKNWKVNHNFEISRVDRRHSSLRSPYFGGKLAELKRLMRGVSNKNKSH